MFDEGTSKAEKKLVWKLYLLISFYSFLVYWVKSLDSSNISNAYVSNMKEDLNFQGNDYINTVTCYNVAAVVFQFPAMYLFPRFPIHIYLPLIDLFWGAFTIACYKATSVSQIQVFRFFIGMGEASFYPCAHYLFGSWFKHSELSTICIFYYSGQFVGTTSSGLFQAAIFRNLNGLHGLAGWRWMFIVDGCISFPLALIGYFCVPGTPYKCYSIWLSDDEIRLARKRLKLANITPPSATPQNFFDKKLWKKVLGTWKLYVLTLLSIGCWNNSTTAGSGYVLWLKSLKRYSIPEVNNLSVIAPLIGILLLFLCCRGADAFRSRSGSILVFSVVNFISTLILLIWDVPESAKWFAFSILYAGWASASVIYSWCNDILRNDPQERAITFILLYAFSQSTSIWITKLAWETVDAPRYTVGYGVTLGFIFFLVVTTIITLYYYKREERKSARENGIVLYNSKTGDISEEAQRYLNSKKELDLESTGD